MLGGSPRKLVIKFRERYVSKIIVDVAISRNQLQLNRFLKMTNFLREPRVNSLGLNDYDCSKLKIIFGLPTFSGHKPL